MSATRKDVQSKVQEQETETGVEPSKNPRNDFVEQMATQYSKVMEQELVDAGLAMPDEQHAAAEPEPAATPETKSAEPQRLSEDDLAKLLVKTKVDGEERELPVAELVKSYQKDSAASRRLEDAVRRQRELDTREAELAAKEAALQQPHNPPDVPAPSADADALARQVYDSLLDGDENKAIESIKMLMQSGRSDATPSQPIDPAEVVAEVRQQIRTEAAMEQFGRDYSDIVADPYLAQVADAYLEQELQDGNELSVALKKAGDSTRVWLQQKTGSTSTASQQEQVDEKLAHKQELDNPPAAFTRQGHEPVPIETTPEAAGSVIAEMRKARGLPV